MKVTEFLVGAGWSRTEAWDGDECGWLGKRGVCIQPARWQRLSTDKLLCAQHAKMAIKETPEWELALQRQGRI